MYVLFREWNSVRDCANKIENKVHWVSTDILLVVCNIKHTIVDLHVNSGISGLTLTNLMYAVIFCAQTQALADYASLGRHLKVGFKSQSDTSLYKIRRRAIIYRIDSVVTTVN